MTVLPELHVVGQCGESDKQTARIIRMVCTVANVHIYRYKINVCIELQQQAKQYYCKSCEGSGRGKGKERMAERERKVERIMLTMNRRSSSNSSSSSSSRALFLAPLRLNVQRGSVCWICVIRRDCRTRRFMSLLRARTKRFPNFSRAFLALTRRAQGKWLSALYGVHAVAIGGRVCKAIHDAATTSLI